MHGTLSYDLAKLHQAELVAEADKHRKAAPARQHEDHGSRLELRAVGHGVAAVVNSVLAAIGLGPRATSAPSHGRAV
jgi:hypothetical protein